MLQCRRKILFNSVEHNHCSGCVHIALTETKPCQRLLATFSSLIQTKACDVQIAVGCKVVVQLQQLCQRMKILHLMLFRLQVSVA